MAATEPLSDLANQSFSTAKWWQAASDQAESSVVLEVQIRLL